MDKYGEINNWDVSNVNNMDSLFSGVCIFYRVDAMFFNQPLDNWAVVRDVPGLVRHIKRPSRPRRPPPPMPRRGPPARTGPTGD